MLGIGVGFAGTPASHSLTGSVPVKRAGMASGTADLQRDLGGAIMQSTFGALLTAGYATAFVAAIGSSPEQAQVTSSVQSQLTKSFASAEAVAAQYPQYATEITAAAKESFLQGDQWAYLAGIVAVLLGAAVVFDPLPQEGGGGGPSRPLRHRGRRGLSTAQSRSDSPLNRKIPPRPSPTMISMRRVRARSHSVIPPRILCELWGAMSWRTMGR